MTHYLDRRRVPPRLPVPTDHLGAYRVQPLDRKAGTDPWGAVETHAAAWKATSGRSASSFQVITGADESRHIPLDKRSIWDVTRAAEPGSKGGDRSARLNSRPLSAVRELR